MQIVRWLLLSGSTLVLSLAPVLRGAQIATVRNLAIPAARPGGETLYEALGRDRTGIDFVNAIDNGHALRRLYVSGFASSGIAIGDVDGDGWADLYLTRGPGTNKLYRQKAPFQFEDITERAGVAVADDWSAGAAFADVNNDGHLDLYVCLYDAPNRLFLNDGNGGFKDTAVAAGVAVQDSSLMAYFQDYDRDGDLDFYLLSNRLYRPGGEPKVEPEEMVKMVKMVDGVPRLLPEHEPYFAIVREGRSLTVRTAGRADRLFRNDGTGKFEDVTASAGISGRHYGLSAVWMDYDHDGLIDLYVANDFKDPDRLYRNQGDGTFVDVIEEVVPHTPWFSMGSDAGDVNNDGLIDLMVADMSSTTHYKQKVNMGDMSMHREFMDTAEPRQLMRNALFLNSGTGRFLESAHQSGMASSDWSWAVKMADLDNDGWNDVFVTNGMTAELTNEDLWVGYSGNFAREEWDLYKDKERRTEPNLAFRNRDGWHFDETGKSWGLDHSGISYAAAWGDLDRDGNLDLVVANLDQPLGIYRHRGTESHRVTLSLRGTASNRDGIGATVRITAGGQTQMRVLNPGTGYLSSNEPLVHFGLGTSVTIERLEVDWPSGSRQVFANLNADCHYRIEESGETGKRPVTVAPPRPMFAPRANLEAATHRDAPFDDFQLQPLLPNKLSQLGPGLAIGDLRGNGAEGLVMGGARGTVPAAHFRIGNRIAGAQFQVAAPEALSEDMGTLLFDSDGDGDLDWYIASGGVEHGNDEALLQDRLYLNVRSGVFAKAPAGALPAMRQSSGTVSAADFDRDGDLDLFVGSRVTAGSYPRSPGGVLLRNETSAPNRPVFTDVTDEVARELREAGMVTSALWSDANGDGWIDLLVTTEWGPVRLYLNKEGRLEEATGPAGLAAHTGWWNGIAGCDLDHDGDLDYVATNFGHNTKYHPTAGKPVRIYYGTFGDSPKPRIIEAKLSGKELLPVRGKSCSQNAMPFIGKKFPKYHDFASANLLEIYTPGALENAEVFEATTLGSSVLRNDGTGRFSLHPLPPLAQIAPGFGVVTTEVNGDGHPDIYLVQNFFTPQRETGKMAGGLSALLLGDGAGDFAPVWPNQSGLLVAGDAKSLAAADLNSDGWVDFAVGQNNGPLLAFTNQPPRHNGNRMASVTLRGLPGNPTAIGARVTLETDQGKAQTAEVQAGGSYLAQSSPVLFFGLGKTGRAVKVTVRWPDGKVTTHPRGENPSSRIVITQPKRGE